MGWERGREKGGGMSQQRVELAKARHRQRLLAYPGVVWVGVGMKKTDGRPTGELAVIVGVQQKRPADQLERGARLPTHLRHSAWALRKTVKTDVVQAGTIKALSAWTERHRPAPGGVSIGHVGVTAGTLGLAVRRAGRQVILSNNHVLANSGAGTPGDAILQPGAHDGGSPEKDALARLAAFVPISFDGTLPGLPDQCPIAQGMVHLLNGACRLLKSQTRYAVFDAVPSARPNYVDAAIAEALQDADVDERLLGPDGTPTVTMPTGLQSAEIGLAVRKSGRTTQWTEGRVAAVQVTVRVEYGQGRTATFEDQVVVEQPGFSAGGDSGSAILSEEGQLVGLLFAGSEQQTIFNRIERVFEALGLSL